MDSIEISDSTKVLRKMSDIKQPGLYTIVSLQGENKALQRLIELGLHSGQQVEFVHRAPFWGPFILRYGNSIIALRSEEAACILY